MSDTVGRLRGRDGTIALIGCTLDDLGLAPKQTSPDPTPSPVQPDRTQPPHQPSLGFNEMKDDLPALPSKSALRKMTPTSLKALCAQRRVPVVGPASKARMVAVLVASR